MKSSRPLAVILVAIFQFIPPLILPLDTLRQMKPWAFVPALAVFLLLGWGLLARKIWALTSTIFVQGFSIIVRLLSVLPGAVTLAEDGSRIFHKDFVIASVLSIALSVVILYVIDRPEVRLNMES